MLFGISVAEVATITVATILHGKKFVAERSFFSINSEFRCGGQDISRKDLRVLHIRRDAPLGGGES